ncbi:hypothetical protein MLD38_024392 [Melastoma candidum]|uniref:Uncharacterized protein n=1 Tax=Melastoma candidum TaxID=119954 RepID=A0ACB9NRV6_9MYRT|nr:hypothetical protein MLD38_024392 [Melastoma candidum]
MSEAATDSDTKSEFGFVPQDSESKLMQCMNNCEDNDFEMENPFEGQAMPADGSFEVDIMDCRDPPSVVQVEDRPDDVAEYSSSFGETDSGAEYNLSLSDGEVESTYAGGGMSGSINNGYGDVFALRKKKLTDHWRLFIQPLRWHCKWLELQMKELNAQAVKYDNALAKYEQRKQLGLECLHGGDMDSKSAPLLAQVKREKVMKRRKRKRNEDTVDLVSYMSHHNLFSFYEKKPQSDVRPMEACSGNLGLEESLDFGGGLSSLEQLLAKIEMAHMHIRKVKARIGKVIGENPAKFASLNSLSMGPRDPLSGAFCDGTSPPPDGNHQSPICSIHVASKKVASGSRTESLEHVIVGPDLREPTTSHHAIESSNPKSEEGYLKKVKIDNPTQREVAKEEIINEDELTSTTLGKLRERPERRKAAAASASASGVRSDKLAEGPSHVEASNKRTTSTTKTYVRKRRRRGRLTARPRKRNQA